MLLWGMMYGEWYGVCDIGVESAAAVCVNYGGMNVFHVCLDFGVVYVVWGLCQCLWCSLCCCVLFVAYVWVLFVVM